MPGLALPFAIAGATAGWLSATFLSNPYVGLFAHRRQELATIAAGLAGLACGAFLSRRLEPRSPFDHERAVTGPVLVATITAAIAASALVCVLTFWKAEALLHGAAAGAPLGLLFFPVCLAVALAARRAARARLGSIVARADRREVFCVLSAALGVATMLVVVDWPAALELNPTERPWPAVFVLGTAAVLNLGLLALDMRAVRVIRRIASDAARLDEASAPETDAAVTDLGLGEELHGKESTARHAYRDRGRIEVLVLGSPALAIAALKAAIRRKTLGVVAVVATLGLHGLAARPEIAIVLLESRCDAGVARACSRAADLTEALAAKSAASNAPLATAIHRAHAADLHVVACRIAGDVETLRRSCAAAAEAYEAGVRGGVPDTSRAGPMRARACEAHDEASCIVLARTLVFTEQPSRDLARAASLFWRACNVDPSDFRLRSRAALLPCALGDAASAGARRGKWSHDLSKCIKGSADACRQEAAHEADDEAYARSVLGVARVLAL